MLKANSQNHSDTSVIPTLASRLALIQESTQIPSGNQPQRKMGRQMASHGFLEGLRRHAGGRPHLLKAQIPSSSLRAEKLLGKQFSPAIPIFSHLHMSGFGMTPDATAL